LNVNGNVNLVWGNNTNITYGGTLSGSGTVNVFVLGAGSLVNFNGPMDTFSGTLNLGGVTSGQFRLNNGGGNPAVGGPNITLDLGTAPVTFSNRNGTTITFGALISGAGPSLTGTQTGAGVTTYSIGALNTNTTYGGTIVNGGGLGTTTIMKVGTGVLTLTGNNTYTGVTTVTAGKLVLAGSGPQATIFNAGTTNTAGQAGADVKGGRLVFDYTGGSTVGPQVLAILDAGFDQATKFSAGQIRTSNAASNATGLGWNDNPATSQVTVAFTYYGDTNLDGQVDVADLGTLATSWQTNQTWAGGDFDYSGSVDVADLGLLATNWQAGVGNPLGPDLNTALASLGLPSVAVPEPASIGILAGFTALSLKWRRKN
jgi:autotransporter-associated beta strand protein